MTPDSDSPKCQCECGCSAALVESLKALQGTVAALGKEEKSSSWWEKFVLPLVVAAIAGGAGYISVHLEEAQKRNEFELSRSNSVEQIAKDVLKAESPQLLTVLLRNRGDSGSYALLSIVQLRDEGVALEVRESAGDALTDLMHGKDLDVARRMAGALLDVLKSKNRFEFHSHRVAARVLADSCTPALCAQFCRNEADASIGTYTLTQRVSNIHQISSDQHSEVTSNVDRIRRSSCSSKS